MLTTFSDNDVTTPAQHRYTLNEIVEGFGLELWDTDRPYPIFNEAYRETLNNRIYDHFRFRRIAASTPQQFIFYLNRRMRENMPAYNEIYKKLAKDDFDPFLTSEGMTHGSNKSDNEATSGTNSNTTGTGTGHTINSNTPASFMQNPADPKYMSGLVQTESSSETGTVASSSANNTATGMSDTTSIGRSGYLGDNITNALLNGFLNTDRMVCDMLEPLFMQFWDDQPL